jgi:shikimate kinase
MNSILFGFKGCGKTYFGNRLASKLQCPFIDTDDLILSLYAEESKPKPTIKSLYAWVGEEEFRNLEMRAVTRLIGVKNSVIALGGGAILHPRNFAILQAMGVLIYLQVGLGTLQNRGVSLLAGPIEKFYHERISLYESIPAHCIQVDSLEESQVLQSLYEIATEGVVSYGL